ncbi:solute carrier family 2, facilitated glucose transporter member 1 [Aplysia californica]|uniref:Solute carrier family 2, facilitated glucose transporter member 1 n=1 Tax=Aplysia californica TaxID=6500 RepID=A0ABM0JW56_APLCA|nr:solute carrier family 2, facilitated glucose transporter member 1 [Aplysia californica]
MADDEKSKSGQGPRVTGRLLLCICGAVMGSFSFGYNLGVINAPESLIKDFMNTTQYNRDGSYMSDQTIRNLWALTASIFSVGGMIGGITGGWWATKLGRKGGSLANTAIGIVAAALMFASRRSEVYELVIIGRTIVGIHSGLYSALSPMYLSEISTPNIRGAIGVLHQLAIVSGMLVSQILGFPVILGQEDLWDVLLGLAVVPCLVQILILPFCPESPRYLLINKQDEKACRAALTTLRGGDSVEDEVEEIQHEMAADEETVSIIQLFRLPSLRTPIIIGIVMQLSQQLSGINGVFFYSTSLFEEAGMSETDAKYTTSAVGAVMVTMTLITVPLIDRLGRRTLHLAGLGGMAVFSVLITISLALEDQVSWFDVVTIPVMLLYVVFFALGPGSIPWLIVAELFSHSARPAAMSVCTLVNWLFSFIVGFVFPSIQEGLQDYTFLPFTVLLVLFFIFTFFKVPETKGKTFKEVAAIWEANGDTTLSTGAGLKYLGNDIPANGNGTVDEGDKDKSSPGYGTTNLAYSNDA